MILLSRFLHKLPLGFIDCPELLSLINLKINNLNTRDSKPFYPLFSNEKYILTSPANHLKMADNSYAFDFI